jgi:hypothetical protein
MMGHIIFRHGTARDPAHLKEKKGKEKLARQLKELHTHCNQTGTHGEMGRDLDSQGITRPHFFYFSCLPLAHINK